MASELKLDKGNCGKAVGYPRGEMFTPVEGQGYAVWTGWVVENCPPP